MPPAMPLTTVKFPLVSVKLPLQFNVPVPLAKRAAAETECARAEIAFRN